MKFTRAMMEKCRAIEMLKPYEKHGFDPGRFADHHIVAGEPLRAVEDALGAILNLWPEIDNPWRFGANVVRTKARKYTEEARSRLDPSEMDAGAGPVLDDGRDPVGPDLRVIDRKPSDFFEK